MELRKALLVVTCFISVIVFSFISVKSSQSGWETALLFSAFLFSVLHLLFTNDYTYVVGATIFSSHVIYFEGMEIPHAIIIFLLIFPLPVLLLLQKPHNTFIFKISIVSISIVTLLGFLLNTNPLNPIWLIVFIETVVAFIITQHLKWNIYLFEKVILWHLVLLLVYGLIETVIETESRIGGPFSSATAYGVIVIVEWSIVVTSSFLNQKSKTFLTFISIITFFIILKTGTRMTLVGFIITGLLNIVFFTIIKGTDRNRLKNIFLLLLSGLLFLSILAFSWDLIPNNSPIKRNVSPLNEGNIDLSNMGRIAAWVASFNMFLERPFVGVGNGNFGEKFLAYYNDMGIDLSKIGLSLIHAHNIYLRILSENGLLGFSLFLIILFLTFKTILKHIDLNNKNYSGISILTGLLVLLFLGLVDAIPFLITSMIWAGWFFGALIQLDDENKPAVLN